MVRITGGGEIMRKSPKSSLVVKFSSGKTLNLNSYCYDHRGLIYQAGKMPIGTAAFIGIMPIGIRVV